SQPRHNHQHALQRKEVSSAELADGERNAVSPHGGSSRSPIGSSNGGTTMGPPARYTNNHHHGGGGHHGDDRNFISPQPTSANRLPSSGASGGGGGGRGPYKKHSTGGTNSGGHFDKRDSGGNGPRRRRTRCKNCEACQRSDCGECSFCLDMVKFGGPGRAKQTCMMRQCLQPMLPVTAQCIHCNLDGWRQAPITAPAQAKLQAQLQEGPSALMECSVCYEISHPDCAQRAAPEAHGIVNDDLPNSWECPTCCKMGKNTDYRPRHFRARQKSSEIRRMSVSSDASSAHNADFGRIGGGHGGGEGSLAGGDGVMSGSNVSAPRAPRFQDDMLYDFAVSGSAVIVGSKGGNILFERKPKIKDEDISSGSENDASGVGKNKHHHTLGAAGTVGAVKVEVKDEPLDHHQHGYAGNHHHATSVIKDGREIAASAAGGVPVKRRKSDEGGGGGAGAINVNHGGNNHGGTGAPDGHDGKNTNHGSLPRKKSSQRMQLAHQIHNTSTKPMKKPLYPIRPASSVTHTPTMPMAGNYALDATCLLAVFRYLPPETLATCTMVCKTWSNIAVDQSLWKRMNCAEYKLSPNLLSAIVRRQPEHLIMDWIGLGKRQVTWLISRIPGLKNLSLQGTHIQAVLGLHTCMCPPLQVLDLSFIAGLNDFAIREILSPPKDSRPGLADSKSRLRNLKMLKVAGADISDVALRYITQGLPNLTHLDLSSCQRITDAAIAQIGTSPAAIRTLIELDLSCCKLITELSLDHLAKCDALTRLDLSHVPQVSTQSMIKFASTSKNDLQLHDIKLVDKRKPPSQQQQQQSQEAQC
uniref:CXXC-type domain-containing protein n=1 Tax=Anopheles maculatus TaxID=74869 RepID=A0A182TAA1_9DIPT